MYIHIMSLRNVYHRRYTLITNHHPHQNWDYLQPKNIQAFANRPWSSTETWSSEASSCLTDHFFHWLNRFYRNSHLFKFENFPNTKQNIIAKGVDSLDSSKVNETVFFLEVTQGLPKYPMVTHDFHLATSLRIHRNSSSPQHLRIRMLHGSVISSALPLWDALWISTAYKNDLKCMGGFCHNAAEWSSLHSVDLEKELRLGACEDVTKMVFLRDLPFLVAIPRSWNSLDGPYIYIYIHMCVYSIDVYIHVYKCIYIYIYRSAVVYP